jgi:hypothetical protein
VQLATELQDPGDPTWADILLAVGYIADITRGKESSKKKDMNSCRIWKSPLSTPLPLNLVQVSINPRREASFELNPSPLFEVESKPSWLTYLCS